METSQRVLRIICSLVCSPFGGIPRNWKHDVVSSAGGQGMGSSPFGGVPRNWKHGTTNPRQRCVRGVPPSGGSLEIGNWQVQQVIADATGIPVGSPFGGIPRNWKQACDALWSRKIFAVPPSGGSLEIGNTGGTGVLGIQQACSPFGGIPRNWKRDPARRTGSLSIDLFPLRGDP